MLGLQNTADKKTSEGRLIVHDSLGRWEEGTLCVNCAQLAFPATPLFAQFRNLSCPPASCHGWQGHAPCHGLPWSPCHHGSVVQPACLSFPTSRFPLLPTQRSLSFLNPCALDKSLKLGRDYKTSRRQPVTFAITHYMSHTLLHPPLIRSIEFVYGCLLGTLSRKKLLFIWILSK